MTVREDMLNGHDICHGGLIATLADSAFAFACNSYNELTVASGFGDRLRRAGAARRRADRALQRGIEGRTHRRLRRRRHQPARRASRGVSRTLVHHQGQARRGRLSEETTMPVKTPAARRPRADRDARAATSLQALQLQRLQWTLQHAYDNVPHYRAGLRRERRAPGGPEVARRPGEVPVHRQEGPARPLPVRHVRGAARAGGAHPRVVAAPPASRRWSATRSATSTPGPIWWRARSAPRAAAPATSCTWPTATASSPAASARTTAPSALGCTVIPMSGGQTEKQVQLIQRLQARHHHGDAELHAGDHRGDAPAGTRSARVVAEGRHLRRRAVDRGDAPRHRGQRRHRCGRHLRPVGSDGPGRRQRVHRDARTAR